MAGPKLTSANVAKIAYKPSPAGWSAIWHPKLKGFGLRITANGARSFVVKFRLRGARATRLCTIGPLPKYTFGEAYEVARKALRDAEEGRDYFEAIRRKRKDTLGEVWRYYVTEHLSGDDISERTRRDHGFLWKNHCTEFDRKPLADITGEKVRDWHRRITRKSGGYVANRAAQALRAAWNHARKFGRAPRELENPFAAIELNPELARQTILQDHQVPKFFTAMKAVENPFAAAYLWTMFYSGARRTELLHLEWRDVELLPARKDEPRQGSIMLRHTKGGEPRRVELSGPVVEMLEALPRTASRYVFAGAHKDRPVEPEDHWRRVREAAGVPELRMHDLRRSVGSWLGAAGATSKMVGTILGHKSDVTSKHYIALGEAANLKRELAAMHARIAQEFAQDKPRAGVVDLKARAHR